MEEETLQQYINSWFQSEYPTDIYGNSDEATDLYEYVSCYMPNINKQIITSYEC